MHGGAIGFASKAGVGSTFSFYITSRICEPPLPMSTPQQDPSAQSKRGTKAAAGMALRTRGQTTYILIVEDNLVNQRVLAKQLRNLGMEVAVANHGGEALEYLYNTKFCRTDESARELSLILMDWEMPVMNGLTCVRKIRSAQREGLVKGHVPVIGITANVRTEQVQDALESGMDDVLSKPFRIPELCACIEKTLCRTSDAN